MDITRRTALTAGVTGAGVLALAACGSPGSSGSGNDTTSGPRANTGTGTVQAHSGGGTALAKLDDITVGQAVSATLDGNPVLVSRPTDATAACFSAICTHEGCTVAPAGTELKCPCHQSVFKADTGEVVSGPAPRALDKVDVTVENGEVVASG